jgi:hypothetical protein
MGWRCDGIFAGAESSGGKFEKVKCWHGAPYRREVVFPPETAYAHGRAQRRAHCRAHGRFAALYLRRFFSRASAALRS